MDVETDKYREDKVNKVTHIYTAKAEDLRRETYAQIEKMLHIPNLTDADKGKKDDVELAINTYLLEVYKVFAAKRRTKGLKLAGTPENFTVTVSRGTEKSRDNYELIRRAKIKPKKKLIDELNKILNTDSFNDNSFDTGHKRAVAQIQAVNALTSIGKLTTIENSKGELVANSTLGALVADTKLLKIVSEFRANKKVYTVTVADEASKNNRGKAEDKRAQKITQEALREFLAEKVDWKNQKSSDSYMEFLTNTIIEEASKSKYYKGKKVRPNTKGSSASVALGSNKKEKSTVIRETESIRLAGAGPSERKSPVNLIALINAKLPEEIRSRMNSPALVWRTGRFANSVQAIKQNATRNQGTSIEYTYQRSPYQVFERTLGRAPWNTPERDPRDLIDASIRSIAAGIMQGRFYTRRV